MIELAMPLWEDVPTHISRYSRCTRCEWIGPVGSVAIIWQFPKLSERIFIWRTDSLGYPYVESAFLIEAWRNTTQLCQDNYIILIDAAAHHAHVLKSEGEKNAARYTDKWPKHTPLLQRCLPCVLAFTSRRTLYHSCRYQSSSTNHRLHDVQFAVNPSFACALSYGLFISRVFAGAETHVQKQRLALRLASSF